MNFKEVNNPDQLFYDKNGNIFTYNITSLIPDLVLSDTVFTFNEKAYPDVEVIDMR